METFEKIYNQIYEKEKSNYEPIKQKIKSKTLLYIYFFWMIVGAIQMIVKNLLSADSLVFIILKLVSTVSIFALIIGIFVILNTYLEYWKIAPRFKKEVGKQFWEEINKNNIYICDREKINNDFFKNQIDILFPNSLVLDIEESLEYENIHMCTVKFINSDKRRKSGIFTVIDDCNKLIEKDDLKDLNFKHIDEIIKVSNYNQKLFLFFDATEVFYFNSKDFFSKKELKNDYERYNSIVELSNYCK